MAREVGHDEIGADADQAIPLPVVDVLALRLFGRDADGDAAHQLHFFDFDIAVAEADNLVARDVGVRNDEIGRASCRERV